MNWHIFWSVFNGSMVVAQSYYLFMAVFEWRWSFLTFVHLFFTIIFFFWYLHELKEWKKSRRKK